MASLGATISAACQGTQGVITVSAISDVPGAPAGGTYSWTVIATSTGTDYGGPVLAGDSVSVPDNTYTVRVHASYPNGSTGSSTLSTYEVNCAGNGGGGGGTSCDLVVTNVTVTPPTSPGGFGYVTITYTTTATHVLFGISGPVSQQQGAVGNTGVLSAYNLPAGTYGYAITRGDDGSCSATGTFTVAAAPAPADPSLNDPARWEPVGGVLPNPVLLQAEATLTDSAGALRTGLHVQVELWRPAAQAAFASFRATVRQAVQQVDAAPYLRAELVALQRYPATASAPLVDADAGLCFFYRFRVVDRTGPEAWLTRAGERYAVLAALPAATDTMQPYVAATTGRVASVFDDYEGVQFVGLPLEATVLLPPNTGTPRWAELRYLDAYRNEVEIRSYPLDSTLPAGVLRIPLPADVLPCAAFVQVAVRDDNRAYVGTCADTATTPPEGGGGYLLTNTGKLKL